MIGHRRDGEQRTAASALPHDLQPWPQWILLIEDLLEELDGVVGRRR